MRSKLLPAAVTSIVLAVAVAVAFFPTSGMAATGTFCTSSTVSYNMITAAAPVITTMFFDQGVVYAPSLIVAFGPAGLPSKMRFTLQHPATGSLQDIYCVRPYLGVCNSVSSSSTIGASISVSGVVNPTSLEWDGQSLTFQ